MALVVRTATVADADVIVEFNQRLAQESEGKTLDAGLVGPGVRAGLTDPAKALYFVAEENGAILGQMMITLEWSDWRNGWFWWVQSVYVRADSRRRGVFRAIYRHVEAKAKQNSAVIGIRLYVERDNGQAIETYKNLGLEPTHYSVYEKYPLG